jgi:transcriptional regulator with XRE-family HTH domain
VVRKCLIMKFKDKYNISKGYENLFSFRDEKDELDYEAHMLMFRFLSEVEKINSGSKILKNKDLASKLGVSPSYITQLFNGDKLLNFTMLAKIQKVFNITFEINAMKNDTSHSTGNTKNKTRVAHHVNQLAEDKTDYRQIKSR